MNYYSKKAFVKYRETYSRRQSQVLAILEDMGKATLDKIAEKMGVANHCVSGRISELKKVGKIEPVGSKDLNGSLRAVYAIVT